MPLELIVMVCKDFKISYGNIHNKYGNCIKLPRDNWQALMSAGLMQWQGAEHMHMDSGNSALAAALLPNRSMQWSVPDWDKSYQGFSIADLVGSNPIVMFLGKYRTVAVICRPGAQRAGV